MKKNVPIGKTILEGTGVICKGNVKGNFEMLPMEIFNYIELGMISHTDLVVYVKLLQFYNVEKGYAYPTVPQLMLHTGKGGKMTIHKSLKTLEEVGLIKTAKSYNFPNKNIYYVFLPLERDELYKCVPDKVEQLYVSKAKLLNTAQYDKERYKQYLNKQEQEKTELRLEVKQGVPKMETTLNNESTIWDNANLLPEEAKLLEKIKLL